jgi:hypothetical protein
MQPNTLASQGYKGTIFVKNIRKKACRILDPKQIEKKVESRAEKIISDPQHYIIRKIFLLYLTRIKDK